MNEKSPFQHLVFYDGKCGLCDHVVQFLLKADRNKSFVFAPLQGETATQLLKDVSESVKRADSLILIENYQSDNRKLYIFGQGAFRIAWLLGGGWVLLGWLSFLPPFLYNWGYCLVARNRYRFFRKDVCRLPNEKEQERFLP